MTKPLITVGLRHKSILVVEDNANVLKVLRETFTGAGFDTVTASSHAEAVALCDRRAFDVAFVDKRLVEGDVNNRDGLAIIRHISRKNEGTYLVLLTGYGEFEDVTELMGEDIVFRAMQKDMTSSRMKERIREALDKAAAHPSPEFKKGLSARIFCGQEVPGNWENKAKAFLNPAVGMLGLMNFLDEIAQTCSPLLERPGDNGIQRTDAEGVMAGLYWSRGVGEAVIILLAKDELPGIPDGIPRLETWPPDIRPVEILYQAKRKNLFGAIIKCTGVGHTEFGVLRSPVE
jgi:CheY-like chemotaxis protein